MGVDQALLEIERACGSGSVLRDASLLEQYAQDESEVAPCMPEAVVRASSTAHVSAVMKAAFKHGVPVTPRAGGTGRVGGAVPVEGGIVLAFEKMNDLRAIEADTMTAVVEAGVLTGELHRQVETQGLFYPPDPNSFDSCAIGGNLAANAGGPRAFKYGVTGKYVLGMEVVTADGTVLQLGRRTKKGVTGYDLASLVVGSEGTLALITQATLRLLRKPEAVVTLLAFFPDVHAVAPALNGLLHRGFVPSCLELLDAVALDIVRPQAGLNVPENAKAMLLLELDGDAVMLEQLMQDCGSALLDLGAVDVFVAQNSSERERLWGARRELSYSLRRQADNKLSEDVVVPIHRMADLLDRCRALSEEHALLMPTYGHAGDGNLHVNFLWDSDDDRPRVDSAIRALFEEVVDMGGTLSGEHGIGVLKAPYLPIEQSPALIALQERVKDAFDPTRVLNPGKIFPADAKRFHGAC